MRVFTRLDGGVGKVRARGRVSWVSRGVGPPPRNIRYVRIHERPTGHALTTGTQYVRGTITKGHAASSCGSGSRRRTGLEVEWGAAKTAVGWGQWEAASSRSRRWTRQRLCSGQHVGAWSGMGAVDCVRCWLKGWRAMCNAWSHGLCQCDGRAVLACCPPSELLDLGGNRGHTDGGHQSQRPPPVARRQAGSTAQTVLMLQARAFCKLSKDDMQSTVQSCHCAMRAVVAPPKCVPNSPWQRGLCMDLGLSYCCTALQPRHLQHGPKQLPSHLRDCACLSLRQVASQLPARFGFWNELPLPSQSDSRYPFVVCTHCLAQSS